ncbi:glycoside hydrolase family 127 protein [Saccharibacillus brassicae]|uniref:Glycoside hydrolase family 127 protein n=1 Tax=Saccharibacillus brassicae TaxID=2583377 RepID=A0A4Y6V5V9_SACBS|nr:beta-L-arabinofuranosidase domain-containing protein [Saccharibacillus brassicae]QDH23887.1 glycoside hydrolase family 127 protein [Saccharibacillus brassicae]
MLPLADVHIRDPFWSAYVDLVRGVVVPYQWEALNDRIPNAEPSRAIQNFKIAAGLAEGEFYGMVFQDSDVAKWLEAVAYLLTTQRDDELEAIADGVVDLIAQAQHEDGYLNTYYTLKEPGKRWTNLTECHELYCAGHLIEAGVAYYQSTGKRKILEVVCKFADYIDEVFGSAPGKLQGYDGHQEIKLALMQLYDATGSEKYMRLCRFFVEERGRRQNPHFYDAELEQRDGSTHFGRWVIDDKTYSQAHKPIREQDQAVGHAVRFVYMCTGMAHLAAATGDVKLLEDCKRLWDNMERKQMYITGGIGSQSHGEAFSMDYDLPNDTVYAETCASIGLIFFAQRMLMLQPQGRYADAMERALYNTVISGMSMDGKSFFYVNPLEVHPKACCANHKYHHVKTVRQGWFGCACCPPNVARLLASLGQYIYTVQDHTVYANLYISGESKLELGGQAFVLHQQSNYPWDGDIRFTVEAETPVTFELALRIPNWCEHPALSINGVKVPFDGRIHAGYVKLEREWQAGDSVELALPMTVARMKGHPLVRQTAGKTALQRGPLVYCLEEADNGANLHQVLLPPQAAFEVKEDDTSFGRIPFITAAGLRRDPDSWGEELYRRDTAQQEVETQLKFIPYFAWANRGEGEMRVWVDEK